MESKNDFCKTTCRVAVKYLIYDKKKKCILKTGESRPMSKKNNLFIFIFNSHYFNKDSSLFNKVILFNFIPVPIEATISPAAKLPISRVKSFGI